MTVDVPCACATAFLEALENSCYCPELAATTKEGVIREMVELLARAGRVRDVNRALAAVMAREREMSTGMQFGVAVPHGKTDAVDRLQCVLACKHNGVEFNAIDGSRSRIFVMTLSPSCDCGPHVRHLAAIGRLLDLAEIREAILGASSVAEIRALLTGTEAPR